MTAMEAAGEWLVKVGMAIIPYSFAFYFPLRWLEYIWKRGPTRLVKATWYAALGATYVSGGIGADVIVMYICFIEASDLTFQQLEVWRDKRMASALTAHRQNSLREDVRKP
jgi:hypothetical protein